MKAPKLLLNEKVEVRQDEEGLRGSWHPGVVVRVLDMLREVEYNELLCENRNSKLIESIPVTGEIDGLYQRPCVKINHRGRIRPRPSNSRSCFDKAQLRFGVCVDALFEDAWWEGVIYDYEDGSDERLVFFPDEGDQWRFNVADLRVTFEWDEFSGNWRERGEWILVKLAEAHKTNIPLSRFIKHVWSHLQANYGFLKMISEWTCGAYSVWKKYFMEVVSEIATKSVHQGPGCPVTSQLVTRRKGEERIRRSNCTQEAGSESMWSCQRRAEARKVQIDDAAPYTQEEHSHGVNIEEPKMKISDTSKGNTQPLVDGIQHRQNEIPGTDRSTHNATTSGRLIETSRKQCQRGLHRRLIVQLENKTGAQKLNPFIVQPHKLNRFTSSSSEKRKDPAYAFPSHGQTKRSRRLTRWQIKRNLAKAFPMYNQVQSTGLISFSVRKQRSCLKVRRRFPKRIQKSKAKAKLLTMKERKESGSVQKEDIISETFVASGQESELRDGPNEVEKQRDKKGRRNDSVCFVCQYGDDLLPCDYCTSSYHSTCIGLKEDPVGNWFCPSCRCGLCGLRSSTSDDELFTEVCYQCSRQYHVNCIDDRDETFSENSVSQKFCSRQCFEICARLHDLIQTLNPTPVEGLSWTIIRSRRNDCNIRDERVHPQVQLSQAMNVLHECFEPTVEPHTKKDLVAEIVYNSGSKFRRLDFHGFYVMALLKHEELACVATLRIHGKKVAEMPLIATPFRYRRKGMCRLLMYDMEKMLIEMGVEKLVLPAISQLWDTWVNSFGFEEMSSQLRQELSGYPFLVFNGTTMFHKVLSESNLTIYSPHVRQQLEKTADQSSQENLLKQVISRRFGLQYNRRQRGENPGKEKVATQGLYYKRRQLNLGKENSAAQGLYFKRRRRSEGCGKEKMETQGSSRDVGPVRHVYTRRGVLAC